MSKTRFILKIKKNQTRQVTWQRNISAVRPGVMFVLPPEIVASEPAYAYATGLINTNRYGFRAPPPFSKVLEPSNRDYKYQGGGEARSPLASRPLDGQHLLRLLFLLFTANV
jgi:hypothetical protein